MRVGTDAALRRDRAGTPVDDFSQQVQEVIPYFRSGSSASSGDTFLPSLDEAARLLSTAQKDEPSDLVGSSIPAQLSGTPRTLPSRIQQIVDITGATEIIVQDMVAEDDLRNRSREIIAGAINHVNPTSMEPTQS